MAWEEGHMRSARESPEKEEKGVDSGAQSSLWFRKNKGRAHCIIVTL